MVLHLLDDDDIRVRQAAAKCFARYDRNGQKGKGAKNILNGTVLQVSAKFRHTKDSGLQID